MNGKCNKNGNLLKREMTINYNDNNNTRRNKCFEKSIKCKMKTKNHDFSFVIDLVKNCFE